MRNRCGCSHSLPSSSFITVRYCSADLAVDDAAGRLVADLEAGALVVFADRAHHHQRHGNGRVDAFLAGRGLDEIGAGHHADPRGLGHVFQRDQVAGGEDRLHVRVAAGLAVGHHLVVQRLPVAGQDVLAGDDDVDLGGAGGHRQFDLAQLGFHAGQAGREGGRHGGDRQAALQDLRRPAGSSRGTRRRRRWSASSRPSACIRSARSGRMALRAQALDAARGVVAGQRGQVDALDGADQPGGLVFLLDRAAVRQAGGAAVGGVAVDLEVVDPAQVEADGRVAFEIRGSGS